MIWCTLTCICVVELIPCNVLYLTQELSSLVYNVIDMEVISCAVLTEPPSRIPDSPEVLEVGPTHVELSWQPPESDGGSPVTGYFIERSDVTGRSWLPINKEAIPDTRHRVDGLHPGCTYEFRIIAQNAVGLSSPSPPSAAVVCRETIGK